MRILQQIFTDVRKRENIDIYLTILVSVVVIVLAVFNMVQLQIVGAAILLVLSVVSFSSLNTRRTIADFDNLLKNLEGKIDCLDVNYFKELREFGIKSVYESLPRDYLEKKFTGAQEEICILQTWMPEEVLLLGLMETVRRGVPLRILLIDPTSEVTKQRLADIGYPRESSRPVVLLEGLKVKLQKENLLGAKVEIRYYVAVPPFCLYAVDSWMLIGFSWQGRPNMRGPHIAIEGKTSMFGKQIMRTFKEIWDSALPIPLSVKKKSAES